MRAWVMGGSLLVLGVGALSAQGVPAAAPASVQGMVFDSVAARPLVGASVQIAQVGSHAAPRSAMTDAAGRYRVSALTPGEYTIGFYADALTDLGLDAPVRRVVVAGGADATVDLAIPSSRTIRTLRCGNDAPESSSGMLVGSVRDALQRNTIADARVRLGWKAFALDSGDYRVVTERTSAAIESDGSLLACRLPIDAPLEVSVTAPGHRTVEGTISVVPVSGIARLDLLLADSGVVSGGATISGRVLRPNGKPVPTGRAVIGALGREVPVQDGRFVIGNLPAGSWVVEARAIGADPVSALAEARDSIVTPTLIVVDANAQRLEAVTVVGKWDARARLLNEILQRKRIGMGTVFLPGHPALQSAVFTSEVMREARGFRWLGREKVVGRVNLSTGGSEPCANIAVFVDDLLQPNGFEGVDAVAPPRDVMAIETYPDIVLAPVQYRIRRTVMGARGAGATYCAVVLIWTKQRARF